MFGQKRIKELEAELTIANEQYNSLEYLLRLTQDQVSELTKSNEKLESRLDITWGLVRSCQDAIEYYLDQNLSCISRALRDKTTNDIIDSICTKFGVDLLPHPETVEHIQIFRNFYKDVSTNINMKDADEQEEFDSYYSAALKKMKEL